MTLLRSVGKGRSFFSFIEDYCPSERETANRPIHRLCSLMRKMGAETAAIESIDEKLPEVREEYSALRDRYEGSAIDINSFRISFIAERIDDVNKISKIDDSLFLASVIIINFNTNGISRSYIYKAIIALPSIQNTNMDIQLLARLFRKLTKLLGKKQKVDRELLLNNYIHVYKNFPCEIRISESTVHAFNIVGTYFTQQNNSTSVCGHAALCMAINNMSAYTGELVTPECVNRIIGTDHKKIKLGSGVGLRLRDFHTTLDSFGIKYKQLDFELLPDELRSLMEYDDVIHKYLESGYPSLLIFRTDGPYLHVVTVLGHTLNTDLWRPEAEYAYKNARFPDDKLISRPASEWVDNLIIHDDNFGVYQCLQTDSLKRTTDIKTDPTFRAVHAVMITPDNVETDAYEAEYASLKITKEFLLRQEQSASILNDWLQRLLLSDSLCLISVIRTLLVRKEDYLRSMDAMDFEGHSFTDSEKQELTRDLPDLFWLSEITLPDLYTANKTKLIDFFYPCNLPTDASGDIYSRWIQIRFPEALVKRTASGETVYDLSVTSHYPLFRLPGEPTRPEW